MIEDKHILLNTAGSQNKFIQFMFSQNDITANNDGTYFKCSPKVVVIL